MKQYTYHISENELLDNHRNCLLKFESLKSLHLQLVSENILTQKIKNFGRLSHLSKQKILLTAYLLHRHPIMGKERKEIFLFGSDRVAATPENYNYFSDYYNSGATLGRGNLFVYTLPSSPLADVAIALKLAGPLLYFSFKKNHTEQLLKQAELHCSENNISKGLLFSRDKTNKTVTATLISIGENSI
jgi:hypothetical protein